MDIRQKDIITIAVTLILFWAGITLLWIKTKKQVKDLKERINQLDDSEDEE